MNKKYLLIVVIYYLILGVFRCFGEITPINKEYQARIVNAIYRAEGGANTKYPYGIKSIKTNDPKKICENTVANNWIRFQKQTKYSDFIEFLGNKFCPVGAKDDPTGLNVNWVKNVKFFMDNKSFSVNHITYGNTNKTMPTMQTRKTN